jgi:serine protease inhibitor
MSTDIQAVNALTARWAQACDGASTTLSGLGVWPLLALLTPGADEVVRAELERATGIAAAESGAAARDLMDLLSHAEAVRAALGLWTRAELPLEPAWVDQLPQGTRGTLTGDPAADRSMLDAWAARQTDGLIDRMPITVDAAIQLVLASALLVRTEWEHAFADNRRRIDRGPWAGGELAGLTRTTTDLDDVAVADTAAGPLTVVRVAGGNDVDVHLILGEEQRPAGDVLAAGIAAVCGDGPRTVGSALPDDNPGPGVAVRMVSASSARPTVQLRTVRFRVEGDHDLLAHADLFGLATAAAGRGHFPGVSEEPLALTQARQSAVAIFSARGFEAAAVTAIAMKSSFAVAQHSVRRVEVSIDRPFGFVATHRPTGLALVAGWVADPEPWSEPER